MATPTLAAPAQGYPVLLALHGYQPNPPRYGFSPDGTDRRPGDYYRSIPSAYASAGFLVVMPDYRGHSNSEGADMKQVVPRWTESDAAILQGYLCLLDEVGPCSVLAHSRGGQFALRAAQARPGLVKALVLVEPSGACLPQR